MGRHGPSIKRDDVYEALRRKGYSKTKSARISNAVANHTNGTGVRGRSGKRGTASKATSKGTRGRGRKR